jgi:hypothetical protein
MTAKFYVAIGALGTFVGVVLLFVHVPKALAVAVLVVSVIDIAAGARRSRQVVPGDVRHRDD